MPLPLQHRPLGCATSGSLLPRLPSRVWGHGLHTSMFRSPARRAAGRHSGGGNRLPASSSQPNMEVVEEQLETFSAAESSMEALLSSEGEAEGEELDAAALALLEAGQGVACDSDSLDDNPYTPEDAVSGSGSSSRPRYASLGQAMPATPELEQLLEVAAAHDGQVTMEQLQALFPFQLDGFQEKAVQQLLDGKSVVVCAPTGAGKTAIAEAAAAATLARGQRVIYTTPLKALSNQKLAETAARFGSSRCGLQTGDTSLNTEADIVVMTTEILRNIMYRTAEVVGGSGKPGTTRDERLGDVGLVVLDEVHYLGDPWRGSVWEEAIINCPRHIQMLAMSATVKNPDDLGGWISQVHGDCATIKTRFRPVPLRWVFCYRAPKTGVQLTELMLPLKGARQQQGSSNSSMMMNGRLNPELRLDTWVDDEIQFQTMREQRQQRQLSRQVDQTLWQQLDPQSNSSSFSETSFSSGSWSDDNGGYPQQQQQQRRFSRDYGGRGGGRFGSWSRGDSGLGRFSSGDYDRQELTRKVMGKRTPPQDQVIRQLQMNQMLPAIWFIMSRKDCDLAAIAANVVLVNQAEEAELLDELQALYDDNRDAVRDKMVPAFLAGVASHHAGCLPAWKSLVERCFQRGLLKLVFATGTLAAGINMPARTTVISHLARRSDEGIQPLPHNELLQMAGRAGRRGYDTQGHCVLVQGRFEGAEVAHGIITAGPEPLQSQFTTSYSLVLNLLSVYSLEEARDFLSKSFGTYLSQEGKQRRRAEAEQLLTQAKELTRLVTQSAGPSEAQKAASVLVKKHKSKILALRSKATVERCQAVQRLISQPPSAAAAAAAAAAADATSYISSRAAAGSCFPLLLLLNLSRHPNDDTQPPQYLPALAVGQVEQQPFLPAAARDAPPAPLLLCLGADNRPMAVSAQHVVGYLPERAVLEQQVLLGQEESLQRLQAVLDEALGSPKVWANLAKTMFSCQVTYGSNLTAGLSVKLNLPLESFEAIGPTAETQAAIEQQLCEVAAAKVQLQQARKEEQQQLKAKQEAAANGSNGSSGQGQDKAGTAPLLTARRLMKQAKKLLDDVEEEAQLTTWNSFMDVLGILVELGAMEQGSLRLLPLGRVARSINCNNELWMAAALSHPSVMSLTPPQLAAFVGALQCTDLLKRPMSIWSSFQVSDAVVALIEELEPTREAIFEAQTAGGQTRWNEHLAVDLRLAGLVEAWAGGASWPEVMQDTSLDDGDMARLLARTADMLKQLVYLEDQLPYLIDIARQALRGMDRKPISDLVA